MKPFLILLAVIPFVLGFTNDPHHGPGPKGKKTTTLKIDYQGDHFTLLTNGRSVRVGRNKKSSVWNTPARKGMEVWIKCPTEANPVRLDPLKFRVQLVQILADYPELHGYIQHHSFQYQQLSEEIPALEKHMERVLQIRSERKKM